MTSEQRNSDTGCTVMLMPGKLIRLIETVKYLVANGFCLVCGFDSAFA